MTAAQGQLSIPQPVSSEGPPAATFPGPYDIPTLLDDVKRLSDFQMARLAFFTIEDAGSTEDWIAQLRSREVPFLLFGTTPVLQRPNRDEWQFASPNAIDDLFNAIREIEELVIETSHIWLPNFLLEGGVGLEKAATSAGDSPSQLRGAVWRVSYDLFRRALRFRHESISAQQFIEACRALLRTTEAPARYSPNETAAFREWSAAQIEAARSNYQEQREDPRRGVLRWRDEAGASYAG